jgi:Type II secretion system (T2SS), protein G
MLLIPANRFHTGNKEINKFYILSICCLIPAFGTILGIVLLFIAVFKFKSKMLFIVVFTATIGGVIIGYISYVQERNELKYGAFAGAVFSKFVAEDLGRIAKKLEKYKIKYGNYPDSLEQLRKDNRGISFKDPLLTRNSEAHKFLNYYYKKDGDKYLLFSSGIDCIPNTADDIYPNKLLKK